MLDITLGIHVVLALPRRNRDILGYAKVVQTKLTNNPYFPTPTPTLAVFAADIEACEMAETAASGRAVGAVANRDAKLAKVVQDLRHLRDYVQGVAEALGADAAVAVESSGFKLRKARVSNKQPFAVRDGAISGEVLLVAKAVAKEATYYWQYSLDGETWTSCPDTMKSWTTIAGLTAGRTYSFRFHALTRAGAREPSQVVTHPVR